MKKFSIFGKCLVFLMGLLFLFLLCSCVDQRGQDESKATTAAEAETLNQPETDPSADLPGDEIKDFLGGQDSIELPDDVFDD